LSLKYAKPKSKLLLYTAGIKKKGRPITERPFFFM
jgi:hypothetical protein